LGRLGELGCRARGLVLVTALVRALLRGDLAFDEGGDKAEPDGSSIKESIENAQINEIIGDIKEILAADPAAKMNAAMKNVLLQVQKYREEAATFKKLKEQATGHRLEMYSKTFAASFRQIFESIRRNYGAYLEEQVELRRAGAESPLEGLEVRPWLRAVTGAAEEVSRLASAVAFAAEEHSGMRGALVALARQRDGFLKKVDDERAIAVAVCGFEEGAARLSRDMSLEIAGRIRGWMED
ncbi:MAG: hypothetical protein WCY01_00150, partial [Alkalispirochaeta sp.]